MDGFYFSFTIPQIGKEFDLLRISDQEVVNIEIKLNNVSEDKIKKQLIKNKYYLSHLGRDMFLYTFIKENKKLYYLNNNTSIEEDTFDNLNSILKNQSDLFYDDIKSLFRVSDFLVSPLNTPDKFLNKQYFLTLQQEEFKNKIMEECKNTSSFMFFGITGGAGTGKTLLIYDLAIECSKMGRCCLIHCGIFSEGHKYLKGKIDLIDIIEVKSITEEFDFSNYRFIFLDECHRIYKSQFEIIIKAVMSFNIIAILSFDPEQALSTTEIERKIQSHIKLLPNYKEYELSSKIRTNKELASFIRRLLNLKSKDIIENYPSVSIAYANDEKEAKILLNSFSKNGYTFINYTKSNYNVGEFDNFYSFYNTHRVIGQEFDNVVMLLNSTFYYDENGKLQAYRHPNPDYLYRQLLYQGLTRVREKLAIIVIKDYLLFKTILSILQ